MAPSAAALCVLGKDSIGIIASTHPTEDQDWAIKSVEVHSSRDALNGSTAEIIIVPKLSGDNIPQLPDVSQYRGGNNPRLDSFDEVRIFAGYLPHAEPICENVLDIIPFSLPELGLMADPNAPLKPIFTGFIGSVQAVSDSGKGFAVILRCHDRTHHLKTTRIVALNTKPREELTRRANILGGIFLAITLDRPLPTLAAPIQREMERLLGNEGPPRKAGRKRGNRPGIPSRTELLLALVNQPSQSNIFRIDNEYIKDEEGTRPIKDESESSRCWREVTEGQVYEQYDTNYEANPSPDALQWTQSAAYRPTPIDTVHLHCWTTRPRTKQGINAFNRFPSELIAYLANSEAEPIEFFSSPINGSFIYGPTVLDTSGFSDTARCNRSYFFRGIPKGMGKPNPRQIIKSIRHSNSSVAMFNAFTIFDSATNSPTNSVLDEIEVTLSHLPYSLRGRVPSPPERRQLLTVDSLEDWGSAEKGAQLVAGAAARSLAKDTQLVQFEVMGDPSLQPGEAIAIYGIPGLHNMVDRPQSEEAYRQFQAAAPYRDLDKAFREAVNSGRYYNSGIAIFRISSVRHTLDPNRGFVSEITGSADY